MKTLPTFAIIAALCAAGCFHVKTENEVAVQPIEVKPIHITMDINLNVKVDKELDKVFADENLQKPQGNFVAIKDMLDRKAAGITNLAMLEARDKATDADRILIAESNARRMKRFADVAKSSGASIESVQRRHAEKWREKVPAGSGVWCQNDSGAWMQK